MKGKLENIQIKWNKNKPASTPLEPARSAVSPETNDSNNKRKRELQKSEKSDSTSVDSARSDAPPKANDGPFKIRKKGEAKADSDQAAVHVPPASDAGEDQHESADDSNSEPDVEDQDANHSGDDESVLQKEDFTHIHFAGTSVEPADVCFVFRALQDDPCARQRCGSVISTLLDDLTNAVNDKDALATELALVEMAFQESKEKIDELTAALTAVKLKGGDVRKQSIQPAQNTSSAHSNNAADSNPAAVNQTTIELDTKFTYLTLQVFQSKNNKLLSDFANQELARYQANKPCKRLEFIDEAAQNALSSCFLIRNLVTSANPGEWKEWVAPRFCQAMNAAFGDNSKSNQPNIEWADKAKTLRVSIDVANATSIDGYIASLTDLETNLLMQRNHSEDMVVDALIGGLVKVHGDSNTSNKTMQKLMRDRYIPSLKRGKTVADFRSFFCETVSTARTNVLEARKWICEDSLTKSDHGQNQPSPHHDQNQSSSHHLKVCDGCGTKLAPKAKGGHKCSYCAGHPDRNLTGKWTESASYTAVSKSIKNSGRRVEHPRLMSNRRADGTPFTAEQQAQRAKGLADWNAKGAALATEGSNEDQPANSQKPKPVHKGKFSRQKCKTHLNVMNISDGFLKRFFISTNDDNFLPVHTLLDSGALQDNFVNPALVQRLRTNAVGNPTCRMSASEAANSAIVNLGGTDSSSSTLGNITFNVKFFNEVSKELDILNCLKFKILDSTFDMIIGLPTIRRFKLTQKIPSFFEGNYIPTPNFCEKEACLCRESESSSFSQMTTCAPCRESELNTFSPLPKFRAFEHPRETEKRSIIATILSKDKLLDYVPDDDDIDWKEDPYMSATLETLDQPSDPSSLIEKIKIEGSPSLQKKIKSLCREFTDIFSETVRPEPADVPPMDIRVDSAKWHSNKNRGPPRPQSKERQAVISKQIQLYSKLKVIEPSTASEYSQVHLVAKSEPNEWRFCLDYVRFNDATVGTESWPIPIIPHTLQRIGDKKPRVFGVMDMTSGYHQAPLSASARILTAFICFIGIFHWLRVPMGLKNAAAYFQRVMATVVLVGLMYIICELYIDDVLVFGVTEDDFILNLKQVFARFRKHKITLNPKKCKLGLSQVEYVGHTISHEGVSFSKEKREKVLTFPLPERSKELMAFLGLVNYFRDHVPDMTNKVRQLRELLENYNKKKKLNWTPELEAIYYAVRDEIGNCPALFFVNEHAPIIVMTDASDFGIGAYIYQLIDNKEKPIIFMSKALHGPQKDWSTVEKECYAIFHTFQHYEYLLKDTRFLLRTDHKNLTYINMEGSAKVKRWKLYIQDFNYDIEHVAGLNNPIADAFSRLCVLWDDEQVRCNPTYLCSFVQEERNTRIPDEYYAIISSVHNSNVGHWGVEKCINLLHQQKKTWRRMRKHVNQFVKQCPLCQLNRNNKLLLKVHPFTTASYEPMDVLNIDTIGPLEKDEHGNEYILAIIDCFSRWIELYAIPDTKGLTAARCLLQHVGRFGCPSFIRHDGGPQFVNEMLDNFARLTHTEQQRTTAYSSEENAIVERSHKETLRHLRAIIYNDRVKSHWSSDQLPLVQRILNSEEKTRTGISPAELLFGNAIDLNKHFLYQPIPDTSKPRDKNLPEYFEKLLDRQKVLIEVAQENQHKFDTQHRMSKYDPNFTEFPINSYVLLEHPGGNRKKLQTKKQGPFQVVNIVGSTYTIQNLINHKTMDVHISTLTPFNYDPSRTDPESVAAHDSLEFTVDSILDHRGDKYRRSTMEFLTRWRGYGPDTDSWEPYNALRDTEALLQYLKNPTNKLKSLIPNKFKTA